MTHQPFMAYIIPMGGGGGSPPGVWQPTFPTNPIVVPPGGAYPGGPPSSGGQPPHPQHPIWGPPGFNPPGAGMPPGIWPGPKPPYVDAGFPMPQPPGTPPLGIWGGSGIGDYIDAGFPGPQPGKPPQIWGGPYFPPVIWPGPGPLPYPDQGLPGPQPEGDRTPKIEWKTAWSPTTGWIVVGVPTGEHVTPSSEKPPETPPA